MRQFVVVSSFGSILTSGPIANTAYCVSKMAQLRLVEYVSEQFGKEEEGGVTCVAVHPGAVATEQAAESCPDVFKPCEFNSLSCCSLSRGFYNGSTNDAICRLGRRRRTMRRILRLAKP